jgi:CRP-like cAMP-binding protein
VVEELRRRFGNDLRYVFRHLPLPEVHPHGELAAEATEAAGAQGAFWAMHDRLFAHQDQLAAEDLLDHAAALGLDLGRFAGDLGEGRFAQRVRDDVAGAEASGVRGTPTFFVNGVRHRGRTATDELAAALLASDPRGPQRQPLPGPAPAAPGRTVSPQVELPGLAKLPGGGFAETPDDGSTPRLTEQQLGAFLRAGRRVRTERGQVLLRSGAAEYDFFVVLAGSVAIVEGPLDGGPDGAARRVVAVNGPGRFLGGLNQLAGQRPVRSLVVVEPGEVLVLTLERLRSLLARNRELNDLVTRSFLLRRAMLIGHSSGLRVVGDRRWPASEELRALLDDHDVAHQWLDPADDPAARRLLDEALTDRSGADGQRPVVLAPDGRVLVEPTVAELLALAGAPRRDLTTS